VTLQQLLVLDYFISNTLVFVQLRKLIYVKPNPQKRIFFSRFFQLDKVPVAYLTMLSTKVLDWFQNAKHILHEQKHFCIIGAQWFLITLVCFALICVVFLQLWYMLMYVCFLASKKTTKEKLKPLNVDPSDPNFSTEGLGQPLKGRPLNDEMIMMEGNANIPPSAAQPIEADGTDSSEPKRDDLWQTVSVYGVLLGIFGTSIRMTHRGSKSQWGRELQIFDTESS